MERDPLSPAAQFALGQSLRLVGAYREAANAGELALALMPSTEGLFELIMQLVGAGRREDARSLLESHPELWPQALVQYAPMMEDWFRFLIGDRPPPGRQEILVRMERGDG